MAKETPKRRYFLIRKRQKKREEIRKLKLKFLKAQRKKECQKIIEKILKIAPHYPIEEILKLKK